MIAEQPGMADELAGIADRAEPLIVKIVGEAVARVSDGLSDDAASSAIASSRGG